MSDVEKKEVVFTDWMIVIDLPELREKFPETKHPNMEFHGAIHPWQTRACPEVKNMLYAAVDGLQSAGYTASLILTEVAEDE